MFRRLLTPLPVLGLAGLGLLAWRAGTPPPAGAPPATSAPRDVDAPTQEERERVRRIITENARSHPVWRGLWEGRIRPGDPVEEVIAARMPEGVARSGRFVSLSYGPPGGEGNTLSVTARDGRVVAAHAGDCTWSHTFFDEMGRSGWAEFAAARSTAR